MTSLSCLNGFNSRWGGGHTLIEFMGMMQKFSDFTLKSKTYTLLHLESETSSLNNRHYPRKKKVILIEDMPCLYHDESRRRFQSLLCALLNANDMGSVPILLIISDTYLGQSEARFFLGEAILDHPLCSLIK
jgi:hypothetical protein